MSRRANRAARPWRRCHQSTAPFLQTLCAAPRSRRRGLPVDSVSSGSPLPVFLISVRARALRSYAMLRSTGRRAAGRVAPKDIMDIDAAKEIEGGGNMGGGTSGGGDSGDMGGGGNSDADKLDVKESLLLEQLADVHRKLDTVAAAVIKLEDAPDQPQKKQRLTMLMEDQHTMAETIAELKEALRVTQMQKGSPPLAPVHHVHNRTIVTNNTVVNNVMQNHHNSQIFNVVNNAARQSIHAPEQLPALRKSPVSPQQSQRPERNTEARVDEVLKSHAKDAERAERGRGQQKLQHDMLVNAKLAERVRKKNRLESPGVMPSLEAPAPAANKKQLESPGVIPALETPAPEVLPNSHTRTRDRSLPWREARASCTRLSCQEVPHVVGPACSSSLCWISRG